MSIYAILQKSEIDAHQQLELLKIYDEAKKDLTFRKIKELLKYDYELNNIDKFHTNLKDTINSKKQQLKEKTALQHNNRYLFITINPKPTILLQDFITFIKKILTKTCIEDHLAVIEQRGTDASNNIGKGFHSHILIKRNLNYKPCKVRDNIKNSSKKMCDINNNSIFNCQIVGQEFARDKADYILGQNKYGKDKDLKQLGDITFRELNNIPQYYGNNNIL